MTRKEVKAFLKNANGRGILVYDKWGYLIRVYYPKRYPKLGLDNDGEDCLIENEWYKFRLNGIELKYGYIVNQQQVKFGSDPEFFFLKDDRVVPGIYSARGMARVAPDGFQAELHPGASDCRQVAGKNIGSALYHAVNRASREGYKIDFSVGREIDDITFFSVPETERRFGCNPTKTPYSKVRVPKGTRTRFRSCGGHIHLGNSRLAKLEESEQYKLVQLLDIICGNTCVLIDRDHANIKRRKLYGRAGEYRMKSYGIEYRVPSNFWLNGYVLWSMVSGLCRNATNIFLYAPELADIILSEIDIKNVKKAINENDAELALQIFDQYCEIIVRENPVFNGGITPDNYKMARGFLTDPSAVTNASNDLYEWSETNWIEEDGFEEFLYNYY